MKAVLITEAEAAQELLYQGKNIGKVVLMVNGEK